MPFLEYAIGANYGRFWRRLKEAGALSLIHISEPTRLL